MCYAHKIHKAESPIDWHDSAAVIERRTRAFDPFPGSTFAVGDTVVKLWRAAPTGDTVTAAPGTVTVRDGSTLVVACGSGELSLLELQCPGGRRIDVSRFLHTPAGAGLEAGAVLACGVRPVS